MLRFFERGGTVDAVYSNAGQSERTRTFPCLLISEMSAEAWRRLKLTLTGEDLRKVVEATSAANIGRTPDAEFVCMYSVRTAFHSGAAVLGELSICEDLFVLEGGGPPFAEGSGVLQSII